MPNRDMVDTSVRGSLLVLANEAPVDELGIVPVMAAVRAASAWDVRRVPLRDLETVLAQSPAKRILGGSPKAVSAPVFQRAIAIASACGARIVVATNGATTDAASTVRLANAPCVDLVPLVPRFEVPILAGALHATPECMLHMALLVHVCGASSALPRVVRERFRSSTGVPRCWRTRRLGRGRGGHQSTARRSLVIRHGVAAAFDDSQLRTDRASSGCCIMIVRSPPTALNVLPVRIGCDRCGAGAGRTWDAHSRSCCSAAWLAR